ncbi:MAG: glycoside hydrolase family 2 [Lentisphaerae bacterium]|nr:glycoside hydrolase family 2 [Lentisphaerota bacterium]
MKTRIPLLAAAFAALAATAGDLETDFRTPPRDARARCWWWWLNSNVDREVISRDLAEMKRQGMGGAAIFDAGGATQDGHRPVPGGPVFAGPEWKALFRHALDEAARHGLELSLNIQSGWNLGGPMVKPEDSTKKIVWTETRVAGGAADVVLPKPAAKLDVYGDVAVVAVPVRGAGPSGATIRAESQQSDHMAAHAADGSADTFWVSSGGQPGQGPKPSAPAWIEVEFGGPVPVGSVEFTGRKGYGPKAGRVEIPDGRGGFRAVAAFDDAKAAGAVRVEVAACTTRVVRLVVTAAHDPKHPDAPRNVQIAEWSVSGGGRKHPMTAADESRITDFEQKAYHVYPGKFNATKAQHLVRPESADPAGAECAAANVVDLTASMDASGRLRWTAPAGAWRVLRFGYTAAGSHVSTCSPGWEGHAVDHMDPAMVDRYWKDVMEGLMEAAGPHVGKAWLGVQTDSWELGPVNWTPAFPAEFKARRGYELTPWMPALAGVIVGSRELSNRFLADFRRTLADLFAEHCRRFAALAHARGFKLQAEMGGPHAAPIDALQTMGTCDFPTGEFWTRNNRHRIEDNYRFFIKQGASAAHIYGHRRMQAESFTSIGPHWERAPGDLKHDLDRAYCEGLNHMMLHTFTCSPASAGLPGQEYFAGTHFNPNVTWWPRSGAFFAYAARCQAMLQAGLFAADVLHYYGDNIPSFVRLKADDPAAVLPGYDYDVCNTEVLLDRAAAKDGRIVLPDGMGYALLSLPDDGVLSLPALRKIAALADAGVPVAGPRPQCRTGLAGGAEADREFAALCERLWGGGLVVAKPVREVLAARGIAQDFDFASPQTNAFYDYIHRRADGAEIYFVVNRWARRSVQDTQYRLRADLPDRHEEFEASFRVTGLAPELWDPMTGAIESCPVWREEKGRTVVPLRLGPEGSVFVVFRRAPAGPHIAAVAKGGRVLIPSADSAPGPWPAVRVAGADGRLWLEAWEAGDYEVRWSDGRATKVAVPALPPPAAAAGPWEVRFPDGRGAPPSVRMEALSDWTKSADAGIRRYSGAARYAGSVAAPPAEGVRWTLDLGDLYEIGGATLNGRDLGTAWHAPFRLDATEAVKTGANALEIEVINVWANRLIGDAKLPPEKRVTKTNITKYERMEVPPRTSGLLGPVELRASRRVEVRRD